MLASLRHPAARIVFHRALAARALTAQAANPLLDAESSILASTPTSTQTPTPTPTPASALLASPLSPHGGSAAEPIIHIPPAEDPLLHLFTSMAMRHGKRHAASRAISQALLHIHAFTKAPPLPLLRQAVSAAAPLLRCRSFKRAAKQYVFPNPLTERQRAWHAIKWILEASDERAGKHFPERLAREVIAIVKGENTPAIKKKLAVHEMAVLHRGNVLRPPHVPKSNRG